MIVECEDLLICDLAETYGVFDYKSFSPYFIATLAVGLPDCSRIKKKYSGVNLTLEQTLIATLVDSVNLLTWSLSRKKGKRPPKILDLLLKKEEEKEKLMQFETPEDYERWRAEKKKEWQNG